MSDEIIVGKINYLGSTAIDPRDAEIARLKILASCACGDMFTGTDGGRCGNCTANYRCEIDKLGNEIAVLRHALGLIVYDCHNVEHGQRDQHEAQEMCPVVARLDKLAEGKP